MFEHHPINIIGFDLGEEKTALAQVPLDNEVEPKSLLLHQQKSQINAIAYHPKKGTIIGERASRLHGVTDFFEIRFQKWPSNDPAYQRTIRDFVKGIYEHLIDTRQIEAGGHNHFFVGCPSGWLPEEIRAYQELLSGAGLPNVTVVRHSRAALMHAAESGMLTMKELNKSVLLIELGFFTTNYTLVNRTSDISIALGIDLGTSQIDKAILEQTLASYDDRAQLEEIFEEKPLYRERCELSCRRAREEYFSAPEFYEEPDSFVGVLPERIQGRYIFEPLVNGPIMEEILYQPMPELGGRSWVGTFRHQLKAVKQRLNQQAIKPAAILLTGEGSKMGVVPKICRDVFPSSLLKLDNESELCIARGLARWGRGYIHATEFTKEMNQFFDQELEGIIERHTPGLIDLLAEKLTNGLVEQVLKPSLLAWRNGQIKTLNDLEASIESKSESWLKGYRAKGLIKEAMNEWLKTVQEEVAKQSDPICLRHGISADALQIGRVGFQSDINPIESIEIDEINSVIEYIDAVIASIIGTAVIVSAVSTVGVIISIIATTVLLDRVNKMIKKADIYKRVRNLVSDGKINSIAKDKKPEMMLKIRSMLINDKKLIKKLLQPIHQGLRKALKERADRAKLLIV